MKSEEEWGVYLPFVCLYFAIIPLLGIYMHTAANALYIWKVITTNCFMDMDVIHHILNSSQWHLLFRWYTTGYTWHISSANAIRLLKVEIKIGCEKEMHNAAQSILKSVSLLQ